MSEQPKTVSKSQALDHARWAGEGMYADRLNERGQVSACEVCRDQTGHAGHQENCPGITISSKWGDLEDPEWNDIEWLKPYLEERNAWCDDWKEEIWEAYETGYEQAQERIETALGLAARFGGTESDVLTQQLSDFLYNLDQRVHEALQAASGEQLHRYWPALEEAADVLDLFSDHPEIARTVSQTLLRSENDRARRLGLRISRHADTDTRDEPNQQPPASRTR